MALYFADHGWKDITIAFPANLRQAANPGRAGANGCTWGCWSNRPRPFSGWRTLHAPVDLWMKVDVGAHRTGLAWDQPEPALRVAESHPARRLLFSCADC